MARHRPTLANVPLNAARIRPKFANVSRHLAKHRRDIAELAQVPPQVGQVSAKCGPSRPRYAKFNRCWSTSDQVSPEQVNAGPNMGHGHVSRKRATHGGNVEDPPLLGPLRGGYGPEVGKWGRPKLAGIGLRRKSVQPNPSLVRPVLAECWAEFGPVLTTTP